MGRFAFRYKNFTGSEQFLLWWNLVLIILFFGIWIITANYLGAFWKVWTLDDIGPYIILNVFLSSAAFGLQFCNLYKRTIGYCGLLFLFLVMVALDFFFVRSQEPEVPSGMALPFYFFIPFYFHVLSVVFLAKIWRSSFVTRSK